MEAETIRRIQDPSFLRPPEGGMIGYSVPDQDFEEYEEDEEDG